MVEEDCAGWILVSEMTYELGGVLVVDDDNSRDVAEVVEVLKGTAGLGGLWDPVLEAATDVDSRVLDAEDVVLVGAGANTDSFTGDAVRVAISTARLRTSEVLDQTLAARHHLSRAEGERQRLN